MRPVLIDFGVLTNDPNGICEDQTTAGAGSLTLDGALVSDGVATAAHAQIVVVEGAGDNSGIDFTITGTDANSNAVSETIDGANNGKAKTTKHFLTVTGVSADGAVTGNVEVGWEAADGAVSQSIPMDVKQTPFNTSLFFDLTAGTMTVSAQYTEYGPFDSYTNSFDHDATWREATGLSGETADKVTNVAFPVQAIRFLQSVGSATGAATCRVIQGNST